MTTKTTKNPILIDIPMPIITPRLMIRPPMPGDGAEIHAAKAETWTDIRTWMPWAKELGTEEDDEIMVRENHAKFLLREDFMMIACDRDTGQPVIFTGLHRFDWEIRRMEIGYWCRKSAQGRGLVTECANALTRFAFGALNARTVAINCAHDNDKSRAIIERLGFDFEGRMKNATITPDGFVHDSLWYSCADIQKLPPLDVTWGEDRKGGP